WTAEAVDSHGTHVAGTVACDFGTTAVVDGVTIPHKISGVAPAAKLGNYNVFPGTLEGARSEDILDALEAAYADGMDIVNMSLGGGASGVQDLLTIAVDNLDRGGMLSAVSAGNEGPGFSTVGSPGSAARALTAGASEVPHIVSMSITTNKGTAVATAGEFGTVTPSSMGPIDVVEGTGPAGVAALANVSLACSAIPAGTGVAVISRGVCDFTVKVQNVQAAGYSAVIVVNRENGTFMMGTNGAPSQPTLPAVMVGLEDVSKVVGATGNVTFNAAKYYNPLGVANQMADFSSEGPTDVDRRIKPDVIAPGVNVLSSVVGGTFEFYNGTSMAAPHLAGAAAVLMGRYPAWMPWQVRSAIVNTASRVAISTYYPDDSAADPNLTGSGLLNLQAAVNTKVLLAPVSLNFGVAPSGAGTRVSKLVALHNQSAGTLTVRVVGTSGGATFTASGSAAANSVGLVTVTATTAKGAPRGHAWATLEVLNSSGTVVAHLRLYVLIT
ncbi:MAG: S8 family serine peptidase, partial [Ilumatobacteraceae bacterium]